MQVPGIKNAKRYKYTLTALRKFDAIITLYFFPRNMGARPKSALNSAAPCRILPLRRFIRNINGLKEKRWLAIVSPPKILLREEYSEASIRNEMITLIKGVSLLPHFFALSFRVPRFFFFLRLGKFEESAEWLRQTPTEGCS